MKHMQPKRDYSLLGESGETGRRQGPDGRRVVSHRHPPQADEGADEALRRAGDPRYRSSGSAAGRCSARPASRSGEAGGRAVLLRLWRALRLGHRFALARMRPWHRLPTRWMNDAVYQIACFMIMRNPVTWRWSHTRHHTDTIIVGARPGNRGDAPAGLCCASRLTSSASSMSARRDEHMVLQHVRHSRRRARRPSSPRWSSRRSSPSRASGWRSMPRRSRWRSSHGLDPAADADRRCRGSTAPGIMCYDRAAAAWRPRRQCHSTTGSTAARST